MQNSRQASKLAYLRSYSSSRKNSLIDGSKWPGGETFSASGLRIWPIMVLLTLGFLLSRVNVKHSNPNVRTLSRWLSPWRA